MKIRGSVHRFADNVDTDVIIPARHLKPEIVSGGIDILVARELTGGIYFGAHRRIGCRNGADGRRRDRGGFENGKIESAKKPKGNVRINAGIEGSTNWCVRRARAFQPLRRI